MKDGKGAFRNGEIVYKGACAYDICPSCGGLKSLGRSRCIDCRKRRAIIEIPITVDGELCRQVPLTKNQYAVVNIEDYDFLMQWLWRASWIESMGGYYAVRGVKDETGKRVSVYMHRLLLGCSDDSLETDHKNGDGLDNRRSNLRPSTHRQNSCNRRKLLRNNTSGYRGVTRNHGKWIAQIKDSSGDKPITRVLGRYINPEDAARAYDAVALILHGDFARLNFPAEVPCGG
jgi:hypothetical protein